MKALFTSIALATAFSGMPFCEAGVMINLYRTGDTTKSSAFTILPGEVFSVDAEIFSNGTDELNTFFAEFTATPNAASAVTFTNQGGISNYRSTGSNYVFGNASFASASGFSGTFIDPTTRIYDDSLVFPDETPIGASPFLVARMEFLADVFGVDGDSVVIDLTSGVLSATTFFGLNNTTLNPEFVDISSTPLTVTFAAVPEPSTWAALTAGSLVLGARRWRRRRIAPGPNELRAGE